jgi:hypothetical protein
VTSETFWAAGASVVMMVAVEEEDGVSGGGGSSSSVKSTLLSNWEMNGGIACTCIDHSTITTTGRNP